MNQQNKIIQWLVNNKKGLIWGFIFGMFIAPILAALGILSSFFEMLRPVLIGPMDLISSLIPAKTMAATNFLEGFVVDLILPLGFNGLCYVLIGGIIQSFMRVIKKQN